MPFAIFGLVVMRRRRIPIFPYLAIAASVTISVAIAYGITRYRAPVDTVLPRAGRRSGSMRSGATSARRRW